MQGTIINITRYCTDDGPGIRTTVFLKGCPLRCLWCHNPESQNPQPEAYVSGERVGRTVSVGEALEEVLQDKVFYELSGGGVTVSGGEPLMQHGFTAELLKRCREAGVHTAIETSGFAAEEIFAGVLQWCDYVLFDLKETDPDKHREFTGVPLAPILNNLRALDESGVKYVLRLPIIPGLNDREAHFAKVRALMQTLKGCAGAEIMPYHRLGEYKYRQLGRDYACAHVEEPSKEQMEVWKGWLK